MVGIEQTGFIPGRSISDNLMMLHLIEEWANKQYNAREWLMFLDQEKAYDRVNHEFLWCVLNKVGINGKCLGLLKAIYGKASSIININSLLSKPFKVQRGICQGDPVSPLLFVLVIESLSVALRQSQ